MNASLNKKLSEVEWGEYELGDLFEVLTYKKRFDANKVIVSEVGKYPYVVRMSGNNGQKGFIDEDEIYLNDGNTISFGQDTATMFYQEKPYFTGDKIKILKPKLHRFGKQNAQFFITAMQKAFSKFSWGNSSFSVEIIGSQKLQLPTKNGEIDFDFMEHFVAELEAERVAELAAYLKVSGYDNYKLSCEELDALQRFGSVEWGEYSFSRVFNRIEQGRRLKKDDQLLGNIPFVMAGTTNCGVANYISNPVASFPSNSITIDIFGNAFYRNYAFGAGDDTGVYWNDKKQYTKCVMLFFSAAMGKSLYGKYSYGKKLRSSQSLEHKMILPTKNGEIDFEYMETFIRAVIKLVIKDVVDFADRKIGAAKDVVSLQRVI